MPACQCCDNRADHGDGQQRSRNDVPCQPACQGVCGGAVVNKLDDFPPASQLGILPVFDPNSLAPLAPLSCSQQCAVKYSLLGSIAPGRSLRALYMSFLC